MKTQARLPAVRQFFARGGALSQWHPQYEYRPGQLEMAEAVDSALKDKRHLIVEAGTGTGKTLAYLVPALLSGLRVVVSTGTKNLQEQLFFKDIPFLQKHFPHPIQVAYMKGRGNYACRHKIYEAEGQPILEGLEEVADFEIIRNWEKTTEIGDRAEIHSLPENSTAWAKVDARRERCTGQQCPQFDRCFITLMQQRASESDLIIVNHHLFFADLAIKQGEFGGIIPHYDAVIFDEAHEMEDVAGQYFGVSLSNYRIDDLRQDTALLAHRKNFDSPELDRILQNLEEATDNFFDSLPRGEGRSAFHGRQAFLARCENIYRSLIYALETLSAHCKIMEDAPEEMILLARRTDEAIRDLQFVIEEDDDSFVYWIERRGRGCFLQATPIEVASLLARTLFDSIDTAILTSATIAVGGEFEYVKKRLGLPSARTLLVPGHFDYQSQALLYVAQHLPDPRSEAFVKLASEEILKLLEISRGRAFVLFTSHAQMRIVYDRVSIETPFPTLLQGTGPRSALLDEFRSTPNAVLFGSSSFWQGVDVAGEQLSMVIIDRLPFAVPSDPIVAARIQSIRTAGGEPFFEYQIPEAAITLKQGFGRLIRSRSDRGVLVMLDNRITRQRYGQVFFDSLPDYAFTTSVEDVRRFFGQPARGKIRPR